MRFQYQTTFFPVEYPIEQRGKWVFKESKLPHVPDESSLYANPEYQEQMRLMGEQGWELISVQPLLEGVYTLLGTSGVAFPITAGYYFFWKKVIE